MFPFPPPPLHPTRRRSINADARPRKRSEKLSACEMHERVCSQARSSRRLQHCTIHTCSSSQPFIAFHSLVLLLHTALLSADVHAWAHLRFLHRAKPVSLHPLRLRTTSRQRSTGCVGHLLRRRHRLLHVSQCLQWVWMCVVCRGSVSSHLHLFQAPLAECHACVIFSLSILYLVSINALSLLITLLLLFFSPEVALHVLSLSLSSLLLSLMTSD